MDPDSCGCVGQSAIVASTIAAALAQGLTADEALSLGTFLSTIGQALEHIAAQIAKCEKNTVTIHTCKDDTDIKTENQK